jgi:DNA-binding beta-propeller fold protein YncE
MKYSTGSRVLFGAVLLASTMTTAAVIPARREPPDFEGVLVQGGRFETAVIARGLARPTGIAIDLDGNVVFTEVPSPGVAGGSNGVSRLNRNDGSIELLHQGEPDPQNLAVGPDGSLYWTCRSAGVILERLPNGDTAPLLTDLQRPTGISVADDHEIYFTQVPTPGVPGSAGGTNTVNRYTGSGIEELTLGEPEPTDIVVGPQGDLYWTCKSAGVVLHRTPAGSVSVLLRNLQQPTGIALSSDGGVLYLTEVPTPGVPGSRGGYNLVSSYDFATGRRGLVDFGDPEPTDVAVDADGSVYWTCSSAGVIVEATPVR